MQCSDIDRLIPTYLDDELAESELHSFEHHLTECDTCLAETNQEREFLGQLRGSLEAVASKETAPDTLKARLRRALDGEDELAIKRLRRERLSWVLPGAATAAAAAALFVFVFNVAQPAINQNSASTQAAVNSVPSPSVATSPPQIASTVVNRDFARSAQEVVGMPVRTPRFRNASLQSVKPMSSPSHSALSTWKIRVGNETHLMEVQTMDARNLDLRGTERRVVEGTEVWVASAFGVNAVSVRDSSGVGYIFISRLNIDKLVGVAARALR